MSYVPRSEFSDDLGVADVSGPTGRILQGAGSRDCSPGITCTPLSRHACPWGHPPVP